VRTKISQPVLARSRNATASIRQLANEVIGAAATRKPAAMSA
jgi:hypothetical protein